MIAFHCWVFQSLWCQNWAREPQDDLYYLQAAILDDNSSFAEPLKGFGESKDDLPVPKAAHSADDASTDNKLFVIGDTLIGSGETSLCFEASLIRTILELDS